MKLQLFKKNNHYTPSETIIIQYLENHLNQIDHLSIQDLAQSTHTSNASIVRLSKKVSCDVFRDLKIKIITERENIRYVNEDIDFSFPFLPADDIETIKESLSDLYLNSIKILRDEIDVRLVNQVAKLILNSKYIFMFGIGDTGITSKSFINKVNKLKIYPIFANENGEQDNIARRVDKSDLVIFTSYESYVSEFQKELKIIANRDCKKVLITSNLDNADKDIFDIIIKIPNEEKEKKVATFFSQFSFQYVFNLLFASLYKNTVL